MREFHPARFLQPGETPAAENFDASATEAAHSLKRAAEALATSCRGGGRRHEAAAAFHQARQALRAYEEAAAAARRLRREAAG